MQTDDRARYKHVGAKGEKALSGRSVAIAGLGGMGTAAASMLARENIDLRLIDRGRVEEEDMHRLSIFYEEDITKFKVKQAKARLNAMNPQVQIKSFHEEIDENSAFLLDADIIVDTTNNAEANTRVAEHAGKLKKPLIIARYAGGSAKLAVLHKKASPALLKKLDMPSIAKEGVFGPIAKFMGSLITTEVLKILLGNKKDHLMEIDLWSGTMKTGKL